MKNFQPLTPRASILDPLLFSLKINDILEVGADHKCEITMFADDCSITSASKSDYTLSLQTACIDTFQGLILKTITYERGKFNYLSIRKTKIKGFLVAYLYKLTRKKMIDQSSIWGLP